jgi:cleavage stimulation factor subunit 3
MRFARRSEGVKSSRLVFSKARRDRWLPWEVYEADGRFTSTSLFSLAHCQLNLALMEYHSSDDKGIPGRIFEKGLELFPDEIDYVQRYLGFLISIKDINSNHILLCQSPHV